MSTEPQDRPISKPMTPEELLKMPQMRDFLAQPSVQEGLAMSSKHRYCHEYQSLMEQAQNVLIELAQAVRAHDETCTNPYECSAPCCTDPQPVPEQ